MYYSKSSAIIAASFDEGFGLPIMEAFFNKRLLLEIFRLEKWLKIKPFIFQQIVNPKKYQIILPGLWGKDKKLKIKNIHFTKWDQTANQIYRQLAKLY